MNKLAKPHLAYTVETLDIIISRTPKDESMLLSDDVLPDSILMRLQEAGEHLARIRDLDPEYYHVHATDGWHRLIGLRNIISHGYRDIDPATVWDVLANHLPEFTQKLKILNGTN